VVLDRDFDGFARTSSGMEVAGAGEGTAPSPSMRPSFDAPLTASQRPRKRAVMACMVVGISGWSIVAGASSVRSGR
jgi:hypothetical protein